ncbi:MAG: RdgB/HAM1 family non-canonical purine NTP pyrophosphatase [Halobacteriales archaeon]|nr:RdgB/HAM1 family non-canonical purine NTP pyrophosphatase [Halobacteriales archaeon]
MKLRMVTGNAHKAEEAQAALQPLGIDVVQHHVPHPEVQADTLEEVARERALWLRGKVPGAYFVDDAGLFVEALRGFPGVYSAYVQRTIGNAGLLRLLDGEPRAARFECCIAYLEPGMSAPFLLKGVCPGSIASAPAGAGGFGFDPVFVPEGETLTFAELPLARKTALSHRGRALGKLAAWLEGNRPAGNR